MKGVVRLSRPKKGAATRLYPVYGRILCSLSARGANCTAGVCANGRLRPVPLCWLGRGLAGRGEAALLATIVLATGVDAYGRRPNDPFAERNVARFILLLLLLDALVQAGFDVTLAQGGRIPAGSLAAPGCLWPLVWRRGVEHLHHRTGGARHCLVTGRCRRQPAAGAVSAGGPTHFTDDHRHRLYSGIPVCWVQSQCLDCLDFWLVDSGQNFVNRRSHHCLSDLPDVASLLPHLRHV